MLEETTPPYGDRTKSPYDTDRTESGSEIKETIEDATRRVREKVSDATGEVRDKVGNAAQHVRAQVEDAAEQVRGFDLQEQVRAHPWMTLGAAAVAGYVFGSMGGSRQSSNTERYSDFNDAAAKRYVGAQRYADRSQPRERRSSNGNGDNGGYGSLSDSSSQHWSPTSTTGVGPALGATYPGQSYAAQPMAYSQSSTMGRRASSQRSQMWDQVRDQFGEEMRTLMTAAFGTVIALVRDTATEHVPQFAEEYERRRREPNTQETSTDPLRDRSGAHIGSTGAAVREPGSGSGGSSSQTGTTSEYGTPRTRPETKL